MTVEKTRDLAKAYVDMAERDLDEFLVVLLGAEMQADEME